MKRMLLILGIVLGTVNVFAQDIYSCRNASFSFFSSAPMEDIEAKTDKGVSAINLKTGAVYFKVPVNTFQFRKKLMQEHFNENYLETDKYPYAEFKGKVVEPDAANLSKDGTHDVMVEGVLSLHGVDKTYREKGTITVQNGQVISASKFNVKLADHKIKIPTLVIKNIAEVVEVTVKATYAR
ncbi:YceI family protein [uncultured Chitinophaga sp.]|jgi:YceI-like domain.|uniref:YceI family protein n=1 Tax=uncultured Chitinophaga sp. TaxID=339340 RepID=UPI00263A07AE|nr:YceI family protein [uncultured Chitinophaga sp.]